MIQGADPKVSDEQSNQVERSACPTCGSCSGMFTANSMNCLTEALGLSQPGNGSLLATHADRKELFLNAGKRIVELTKRYYEQDDASALPRNIASKAAFEKRHDPRYRDGRFNQYRTAPAGGGAGSRNRLHHERYRQTVPQGPAAV